MYEKKQNGDSEARRKKWSEKLLRSGINQIKK